MHLVIWLITFSCLGLWTLLAWALASLLGMDPSWVGDMKPLIAQLPYGNVIEAWVPGWQALATSLLDLAQALLHWLGDVGPWLALALWSIGAACIVGTGALLSFVVVLVRRARRPAPPAPPASGAAATPA